MFLALAQQVDLTGTFQTQIGELKLNHFTDARAGVVEQQKQRPVTDSGPGVTIHGIKCGLHFFLLKVVNRLVLSAFQRDSADSLALRQQGGFFSGDKGEQAADGR